MVNFFRKYRAKIKTSRFYKRLLSNENIKLVYDVGANKGDKSSLFLRNKCKVVAIEPNVDCLKFLVLIKEKYPQFSYENVGLATYAGRADLNIGNISEVSTFSDKFVKEFTVSEKVFWDNKRSVDLVDLIYLFDRYGIPDFIKLDCEGMDYEILKSLNRAIPLIEFEYTKPFRSETIDSLQYISSLAPYEFNFSPYEHSEFLYTDWLEVGQFVSQLLPALDKIIHGNVYCRLKQNNLNA